MEYRIGVQKQNFPRDLLCKDMTEWHLLFIISQW